MRSVVLPPMKVLAQANIIATNRQVELSMRRKVSNATVREFKMATGGINRDLIDWWWEISHINFADAMSAYGGARRRL